MGRTGAVGGAQGSRAHSDLTSPHKEKGPVTTGPFLFALLYLVLSAVCDSLLSCGALNGPGSLYLSNKAHDVRARYAQEGFSRP